MNRKKKGEYIGMLGALLVHVAFITLLILVSIHIPKQEEAGGIPVMMGDALAASGDFDPSTLVDVDILPEEIVEVVPVAQPNEAEEQEIITQTEEEAVAIKPKTEPKKERPKVVNKPEKTAVKLAAEAQKQAEAKAEREKKAAAEIARKRVSGAFGKGSQMGSKGTAASGEGVEGSANGNASAGAKTGIGGHGTFDLGGRSIGSGGLPRPAYTVQEEGKVVVSITVNPAGQVISTSINRQTNTVNTTLRKAAEDAAKRARFNIVDGVNNQTGTITYYFELR